MDLAEPHTAFLFQHRRITAKNGSAAPHTHGSRMMPLLDLAAVSSESSKPTETKQSPHPSISSTADFPSETMVAADSNMASDANPNSEADNSSTAVNPTEPLHTVHTRYLYRLDAFPFRQIHALGLGPNLEGCCRPSDVTDPKRLSVSNTMNTDHQNSSQSSSPSSPITRSTISLSLPDIPYQQRRAFDWDPHQIFYFPLGPRVDLPQVAHAPITLSARQLVSTSQSQVQSQVQSQSPRHAQYQSPRQIGSDRHPQSQSDVHVQVVFRPRSESQLSKQSPRRSPRVQQTGPSSSNIPIQDPPLSSRHNITHNNGVETKGSVDLHFHSSSMLQNQPQPQTQPQLHGLWSGQTVHHFLKNLPSNVAPMDWNSKVVYLILCGGNLPHEPRDPASRHDYRPPPGVHDIIVRYLEIMFFPLQFRWLPHDRLDGIPTRALTTHGPPQRSVAISDLLMRLRLKTPADSLFTIAILPELDISPSIELNLLHGRSMTEERLCFFTFSRLFGLSHSQAIGDTLQKEAFGGSGVSPTNLRAALRLISHGVGRMLGLRPCSYYQCGMNETKVDRHEEEITPLTWCPICTLKLYRIHLIPDLIQREENLLAYFISLDRGFEDDAHWHLQKLKYLAEMW